MKVYEAMDKIKKYDSALDKIINGKELTLEDRHAIREALAHNIYLLEMAELKDEPG